MATDVVFQALSWHAEDLEPGEDDLDEGVALKHYIKVFGRQADGRSVSATITGFKPHFYIKVPGTWLNRNLEQLRVFLMESPKVYRSVKNEIAQLKLVKKMDLVGFTNFKEFQFVRISLHSLRAQRALAKVFAQPVKVGSAPATIYQVYETNIEPFLKFIHAADLDPSGWLRLRKGAYSKNGDILSANCDLDLQARWQDVEKVDRDATAPFRIACFDIECSSAHGDFPLAIKDHKRLASQLYDLLLSLDKDAVGISKNKPRAAQVIQKSMLRGFGLLTSEEEATFEHRDAIDLLHLKAPCTDKHRELLLGMAEDVFDTVFTFGRGASREDTINALTAAWAKGGRFPGVHGDAIIQIGTTTHAYGERECSSRHIITLGTCDPVFASSSSAAHGAEVALVQVETEEELLLAWQAHIASLDPDVLSGYNIFGFDMAYMHDRAQELGIKHGFMRLGRFSERPCVFKENKLSSSALGDNLLRFIHMDGRVLMDIMKVVQRDHKLDSYRLDVVAQHFTGEKKDDVSPQDIFRLQRGSAKDRCIIATYCVQDCELCNRLIIKLDLLAGNMGMSNVCLVPLSYIFMRGQGIKIFSLVLKQCLQDGLLVPVIKIPDAVAGAEAADEESYEGAIVLEPKEGIYVDDPVSVLDYASLYPSSMISENISHDTLVMDPAYDNLPGVEYVDVSFDVFDDAKRVVGKRTCRFAKNRKGLLPRILQKLLGMRKSTRKRMQLQRVSLKATGETHVGFLDEKAGTLKVEASGETIQLGTLASYTAEPHFNEFQLSVLDGLQLAYKVTANSLYGQTGARTSPICLKDIAASTTATGRKMILMAKEFLETHYCANVVYGDSVAGYTPVTVRVHGDVPGTEPQVRIETVESLAANYGALEGWVPCSHPDLSSLLHATSDGKESLELPGVEVWTDEGWTPAHRLIRHALAPHKKMMRITTNTGVVDVTDDHSLLRPDGHTVVKPQDLAVGEELLHADLPDFTSVDCEEEEDDEGELTPAQARALGFYMGCGALDPDGWCCLMQHADEKVLQRGLSHFEAAHPGTLFVVGRCPESDEEGQAGHVLLADVNIETHQSMHQWYTSHLLSHQETVVPQAVLSGSLGIRKEFWLGLCDAGGLQRSCNNGGLLLRTSQLTAATLFALAQSLGQRISLDTDCKDARVVLRTGSNACVAQEDDRILRIEVLPRSSTTTYVYDFTTANHKFAAGIGRLVVHNTDSIFVIFPDDIMKDAALAAAQKGGGPEKGRAKLLPSIQTAIKASSEFKKQLKAPHDLEYEKSFWPFILLSKKRYVGNLYEMDDQHFHRKSMGIAIKRRDSAHIVKKIYGGCLDMILNDHDVPGSVQFLGQQLNALIEGKCPLEDLIITKSLRSDYKNPNQIAHKVLADRMGLRDPGNKPQVNDRIPYLFVKHSGPGAKAMLQGEKIEHPDYVVAQKLPIDYEFYITNQVMNPVLQLYACIIDRLQGGVNPEFARAYEELLASGMDIKKAKEKVSDMKEKALQKQLFDPVFTRLTNLRTGNQDIRTFYKPR